MTYVCVLRGVTKNCPGIDWTSWGLIEVPPLPYSQVQAAISITIGFLTTLLKLPHAFSFLRLGATINAKVAELGGIESAAVQTALQDELDLTSDEGAKSLHTLRRSILVVRLGLVMLCGAICYAFAKFVAAFACDSSMLNLTGCVVLKSHS